MGHAWLPWFRIWQNYETFQVCEGFQSAWNVGLVQNVLIVLVQEIVSKVHDEKRGFFSISFKVQKKNPFTTSLENNLKWPLSDPSLTRSWKVHRVQNPGWVFLEKEAAKSAQFSFWLNRTVLRGIMKKASLRSPFSTTWAAFLIWVCFLHHDFQWLSVNYFRINLTRDLSLMANLHQEKQIGFEPKSIDCSSLLHEKPSEWTHDTVQLLWQGTNIQTSSNDLAQTPGRQVWGMPVRIHLWEEMNGRVWGPCAAPHDTSSPTVVSCTVEKKRFLLVRQQVVLLKWEVRSLQGNIGRNSLHAVLHSCLVKWKKYSPLHWLRSVFLLVGG